MNTITIPLTAFFPGLAEVSDATTEVTLYPQSSNSMHVTGIGIESTSGASLNAGTTRVTASLASLGAGLSVDLANTERTVRPTRTSQSLVLEPGSPLYVHIDLASAGHTDVFVVVTVDMYPFEIEPVPTAYDGVLVTLAEAKAAIRVYSDLVNDQIGKLILGAEQHVAMVCGTPLTVTTFEEYMDGGYKSLRPLNLPLVAVSEVYDEYAAETITSHAVRGKRIRLLSSGCPISWPDGQERFKVTYTAGYNNGNAEPKPTGSVYAPAGLKTIVLGLVRRAFEVRGGQTGQSGQGFNVSWDALATGELATLLTIYQEKRFE